MIPIESEIGEWRWPFPASAYLDVAQSAVPEGAASGDHRA
jgi:hypothetical protein